MLAPGDHVFYPKGGVFVIEKQADRSMGGRKIHFLDLVSFDGKTKISIPRQNVSRVGVRSLLTLQELDKAMRSFLPDHQLMKLHHKNRKSKFELLRQTGNFEDMGMVVSTIHNLIHRTKATFEEKRIYDQTRKRLADEIAIVKDIHPEKAAKLLNEYLNLAISKKPPEEKKVAVAASEQEPAKEEQVEDANDEVKQAAPAKAADEPSEKSKKTVNKEKPAKKKEKAKEELVS